MTETPERPESVRAQFTSWFIENYPAGAELHDPAWHAERIFARANAQIQTGPFKPRASSLGEPVSQEAQLAAIRKAMLLLEAKLGDSDVTHHVDEYEEPLVAAFQVLLAASRSAFSGIPRTENEARCECGHVHETATLDGHTSVFHRCRDAACACNEFRAGAKKLERSKEWWVARAEAEGDHVIGAGAPVISSATPLSEEEPDFSGPTPRPIVLTGCNGECVAEGGYPALCEMYPDNRHVGCSRQTRVRCCGALTVHAYDCKRDTTRPTCATCKREIHTSLPVDFCSEECRSAFSGIPRTENEPSAQQMREALSGIECSLAEFCDESAPNRETMVADAARDAAAAIADLRRNRCRSGEMCSVDGCSSTAVAWRDERGVPYCDQCKRGVSRMRSRSRKTFNPIVLARLSASAPSPEYKGSET